MQFLTIFGTFSFLVCLQTVVNDDPYGFNCANKMTRGRNCLRFLNVSTAPVRPDRDPCSFQPSQYAPPSVSKTLKKVHVVHICHFDLGFTNLRWCVLHNYLNTYFPQVLKNIQASPTYIYQTHPFLVFAFLNCKIMTSHAIYAPGVNVTCPNANLTAQMIDAIHAGQISWQAYAFNPFYELYGPNVIGLGTGVARWLDEQFKGPNVTSKKVASLIDVPGIAASNIPGLKKAGVEALYMGHLSTRVPKAMPGMLFKWDVFGSEMVVMFHPEGYGGIFLKDLIYEPVSREGLLVAGCLENGWPRSPEEVDSMYDIIAANLSVSKSIIQGSTFEDFYAAIDKSKLPVYKGEFGNDWNRASMGDPKKTAVLRAFGRIYQPPSSKPTVERLVGEVLALAAGEHNYGVAYRSGGPWTDYSNHIGPASWDEQRNITNITAFAMLAEGDPEMVKKLQAEVSQLNPVLPETKSMDLRYSVSKQGPCTGDTLNITGAPLGAAQWQVVLNCSGAIVSLNHTESGKTLQFASLSNPLAHIVIPGQPTPAIQSVWTDSHSGRVVANIVTNSTKSGPGGLAAYQHWLQLDFEGNCVNITVWLGKASDPINGGSANGQVYLLFNPPVTQLDNWVMDQQGISVPVMWPSNCSLRHYACVWDGMSHPAAGNPAPGRPLQLVSVDVPLVAFLSKGVPVSNILHMDLSNTDAPELEHGVFFNLMNTLNAAWIRQYPWKDEDYWTKYRFALCL